MSTARASKLSEMLPKNSTFDVIEKLVVARDYPKVSDMLHAHMKAVSKNEDFSGKKDHPVNIIIKVIETYVNTLIYYRIGSILPTQWISDNALISRLRALFFLFESINTYLAASVEKSAYDLVEDYRTVHKYLTAEGMTSKTLHPAIIASMDALHDAANVERIAKEKQQKIEIATRDTQIANLEKDINTLKEIVKTAEAQAGAKVKSEMGILRAEMKAEREADMKSHREEIAALSRPHAAQSEVKRQASFAARLFGGSRAQPSGATSSIYRSPLSASRPAATCASNLSPAPSSRKLG